MTKQSRPNFNLGHKKSPEELDLFSWADEERQATPKNSSRNDFGKWELDVKPLISSEKWIRQHGLKRNRLKLYQILARIGFKHTDSYIKSLKKPVGSYYGEGLFRQMRTHGGKTYNITVGKETLKDIENTLKQNLRLLKRRQDWLNSGSRKIFGVIQEHCVTIVLDVSTMVQSQFEMYREALCEVINDQVSQLAKFNLIRAQSDMLMWQDSVCPVTDATQKSAMEWIQGLDRMAEFTHTSCTEAVIKAYEDESIEAVYLFTEGDVSESSKELLRQKLKESPIPLHTVSFNASKPGTIKFLKNLAADTGGRFHAFVVKSDYEDEDEQSKTSGYQLNGTATSLMSGMRLSQRSRGGIPNGAGVREDIFLVWRELEEARNILADIQTLIIDIEQMSEHVGDLREIEPSNIKKQENSMSSRDWLFLHGLNANKLTIFHSLANYAFKHIDDVIELQGKPTNPASADAVLKLIEAKYCKNFPHMVWKDNEVVHVYVSAELFKTYQRKMKTVLDAIQQRIDWLQQGSREVFGSILEDRIYFLIDSSYSMGENLPVLKDRLMQLFHEQLRHKKEFNLVRFESRATAWRPRLEEVTEDSLQDAWKWICDLEPGGSTNTLAALRIALTDPNTEGIYLLTDGRPDQPLHCILSQIQLRKPVPIHTISFNCHDLEANKFLQQLALDTGGRYHSYTTHGGLPHGPTPFESEDVALLRAELEHGKQDLQKVSDLRDRCVMLDWYYNRKSKKENPKSDRRVAIRTNSPPPAAPCCIAKKSKSLLASPDLMTDTYIPGRPSTSLGFTTQPTLLEISHKEHRGQYGVNDPVIHSSKTLKQINGQGSERSKMSSAKKNKRSKKKKESEVPNSVWLKKNGLMAKKMTIMDALGHTVITQRRKYIPILNTHVTSKVFNEILPIGHVSPRSKKEIKLVNPNAAHLESYELQLGVLLDEYKKRLNKQIWDRMPKEKREGFGTFYDFSALKEPDSDEIKSVLNAEVIEIMEEFEWPVPRKEIQVLVDEINQGEEYLEQSKALREQARKLSQGGEKNAEPRSKPIRKPRRKRRLPVKQTPPTETSSDTSSTEDSTVTSLTSSKESNATPQKAKFNLYNILEYLTGEHVIARSEYDGYYYDSTLMQCLDMRYGHIRFDHGEDQITSTRHILPLSQDRARPHFELGDYVLAKARISSRDPVNYIPGIIIKLPSNRRFSANHYHVLLCNNSKQKIFQQNLIKIDENRYKLTVQFIKSRAEKMDREFELENSETSSNTSSRTSTKTENEKPSTPPPPPPPPEPEPLSTSSKSSQTLNTEDRGSQYDPPVEETIQPVVVPEIKTRESLYHLIVDQDVLARFDDDGWYYRGTVKTVCDFHTYNITDANDRIERIHRENVILDEEDAMNNISVKDKVVALHPSYVHSYAPATVINLSHGIYHVQFYDEQETGLPREEVYLISKEKYKKDVAYIDECEEKWVGQAVVARNDSDGQYHLAYCKKRMGRTRKFSLQWSDGTTSHQYLMHMFGTGSRKKDFEIGDHILSICDQKTLEYLPGFVTEIYGSNVSVTFCNGVSLQEVPETRSYYLSKEYYEQAVLYYSALRS